MLYLRSWNRTVAICNRSIWHLPPFDWNVCTHHATLRTHTLSHETLFKQRCIRIVFMHRQILWILLFLPPKLVNSCSPFQPSRLSPLGQGLCSTPCNSEEVPSWYIRSRGPGCRACTMIGVRCDRLSTTDSLTRWIPIGIRHYPGFRFGRTSNP